MKRQSSWSTSKKGDRQLTSSGGPLRRRRALRHLDSLALDPERELDPATATAHVRVIGEHAWDGLPPPIEPPHLGRHANPGTAATETVTTARTTRAIVGAATVAAPGEAPPDAGAWSPGRLHAVPIDQPFDVAPATDRTRAASSGVE